MTTTTDQRYDLLLARMDERDPIDGNAFGTAVMEFADHGVVPDDDNLRGAVLDIEEAAAILVGAKDDSPWLAFIDKAREGSADANTIRRHVVMDGMSTLRQMRDAKPGASAFAIH